MYYRWIRHLGASSPEACHSADSVLDGLKQVIAFIFSVKMAASIVVLIKVFWLF